MCCEVASWIAGMAFGADLCVVSLVRVRGFSSELPCDDARSHGSEADSWARYPFISIHHGNNNSIVNKQRLKRLHKATKPFSLFSIIKINKELAGSFSGVLGNLSNDITVQKGAAGRIWGVKEFPLEARSLMLVSTLVVGQRFVSYSTGI